MNALSQEFNRLAAFLSKASDGTEEGDEETQLVGQTKGGLGRWMPRRKAN